MAFAMTKALLQLMLLVLPLFSFGARRKRRRGKKILSPDGDMDLDAFLNSVDPPTNDPVAAVQGSDLDRAPNVAPPPPRVDVTRQRPQEQMRLEPVDQSSHTHESECITAKMSRKDMFSLCKLHPNATATPYDLQFHATSRNGQRVPTSTDTQWKKYDCQKDPRGNFDKQKKHKLVKQHIFWARFKPRFGTVIKFSIYFNEPGLTAMLNRNRGKTELRPRITEHGIINHVAKKASGFNYGHEGLLVAGNKDDHLDLMMVHMNEHFVHLADIEDGVSYTEGANGMTTGRKTFKAFHMKIVGEAPKKERTSREALQRQLQFWRRLGVWRHTGLHMQNFWPRIENCQTTVDLIQTWLLSNGSNHEARDIDIEIRAGGVAAEFKSNEKDTQILYSYDELYTSGFCTALQNIFQQPLQPQQQVNGAVEHSIFILKRLTIQAGAYARFRKTIRNTCGTNLDPLAPSGAEKFIGRAPWAAGLKALRIGADNKLPDLLAFFGTDKPEQPSFPDLTELALAAGAFEVQDVNKEEIAWKQFFAASTKFAKRHRAKTLATVDINGMIGTQKKIILKHYQLLKNTTTDRPADS